MSDFQFSEEERKRIEEVRSKAKEIAKKAKIMSEKSDFKEPSGKHTSPSDLDIRRDRKHEKWRKENKQRRNSKIC